MSTRRGLGYRSVRADPLGLNPPRDRVNIRVARATVDRLQDLAGRYQCTQAEVLDRAVEALCDAAREPMASRQVVLIAEAPPAKFANQPERWCLPDRRDPNGIGMRLLRLSGLPLDDFLALFERTCLLEHPVRGNEWPVDEARSAAAIMRRALPGRTAVLLGRRVQQAFGVGDAPNLVWRDVSSYGGRPLNVLVCPHPSSLNSFWNSPHNCAQARETFAVLAGTVLLRRPAPVRS